MRVDRFRGVNAVAVLASRIPNKMIRESDGWVDETIVGLVVTNIYIVGPSLAAANNSLGGSSLVL